MKLRRFSRLPLLDVLAPAVAFLVIALLLFWGIDYRNRGRGLLTSA
jgi:hypothetical protein